MQTFLPYADFEQSARCLDWKRLGKQRVEAHQILLTLQTGKKAWSNHPVVQMWRGYEQALCLYRNIFIQEWTRRGYRNTMEILPLLQTPMFPKWLGYEPFHSSHRSNLLRKNGLYYQQFGWQEGDKIPYYWPKERINDV